MSDTNLLDRIERLARMVGELTTRRDALLAQCEHYRAVLGAIATGATGYSDRDSELAAWAQKALDE